MEDARNIHPELVIRRRRWIILICLGLSLVAVGFGVLFARGSDVETLGNSYFASYIIVFAGIVACISFANSLKQNAVYGWMNEERVCIGPRAARWIEVSKIVIQTNRYQNVRRLADSFKSNLIFVPYKPEAEVLEWEASLEYDVSLSQILQFLKSFPEGEQVLIRSGGLALLEE